MKTEPAWGYTTTICRSARNLELFDGLDPELSTRLTLHGLGWELEFCVQYKQRLKQLMQTVTDIGALIVRTPDTCGGRPRIAATRFSVEQIAVLHKQGLTAQEIIEEYNFLNLAQVYAALAYYHANTEEIEAYLAEEEVEYDRLAVEQANN